MLVEGPMSALKSVWGRYGCYPLLFTASGGVVEKCAMTSAGLVWKFDPKPTVSVFMSEWGSATTVKSISE